MPFGRNLRSHFDGEPCVLAVEPVRPRRRALLKAGGHQISPIKELPQFLHPRRFRVQRWPGSRLGGSDRWSYGRGTEAEKEAAGYGGHQAILSAATTNAPLRCVVDWRDRATVMSPPLPATTMPAETAADRAGLGDGAGH